MKDSDKLNWCLENQCGKYPDMCSGTYHPALCPMMENTIENEEE